MSANLIGEEHEHRFTRPFRGHLMCEDFYCGKLRRVDGFELTPDDHARIHAELHAEYGSDS